MLLVLILKHQSSSDHNRTINVLVSLDFMTHLVHAGGVFEEDKAEAPGSAGAGVHLDGAVRHLAKLTEVILQVFFTRVPAEAAHEHFTANRKGTPWCLFLTSDTEDTPRFSWLTSISCVSLRDLHLTH